MDRNAFGDQVRLKRLKMKLTQQDLAKKINVSQGTISRIEKGLQTNLTDRIKTQLMQALNFEMSIPSDTLDRLIMEQVSKFSDDQKIGILRYLLQTKTHA